LRVCASVQTRKTRIYYDPILCGGRNNNGRVRAVPRVPPSYLRRLCASLTVRNGFYIYNTHGLLYNVSYRIRKNNKHGRMCIQSVKKKSTINYV